MRAIENVKVFIDGEIDPSNRLWISEGIEAADEKLDCYNDRKYNEFAFKPKGEWRKAENEEEQNILTSRRDIDFKCNLALLKIPTRLEESLRDIDLGRLNSIGEAKQKIQSYKSLFDRLNSELNDFALANTLGNTLKPHIHGLFYVKPGLETIGTTDNEYIGLHIDNGDAMKVNELHKAPNRICINIGYEDRYFLFVNKTASDILTELQVRKEINIRSYKEMQLVYDYLHHNPRCQVIKLVQKPFEAYIAPTEHIIHDGCTEGKSRTDVSLVLIGAFGINNGI
ncbi:hypothetical protein ACDQ55_20960 [Chitinophaga sp. 30R24]|uniref:hypothetical protein n=1 Tax=Chitinophaga sp. 30R24 TaxID=3248838 RepID=UPI003B90CF51